MSRDRPWSCSAAVATAALVVVAGCGAVDPPDTTGAASPSPEPSIAGAISDQRPTSGASAAAPSAPLSNRLRVAIPTGYVVTSTSGGDAPVQLSREASIISVAASNGTNPETIASGVLTATQNIHMLTDVRQVGSQAYAPTGHATGVTMISYTATLHVGRTGVPVEGAAVGIVRDDDRAVRVLWMEPPGSSSRYSSAYRDVLVSLTR